MRTARLNALVILGALCVALTSRQDVLYAQASKPPRNIAVIDTLLNRAAQHLVKQMRTPLFPQLSDNDTLRIHISSHEGAWMLEQALFRLLPRKKRFRPALDTLLLPHYRLEIQVVDIATRYTRCEHDTEMLTREITCLVRGVMETGYGAVQELEGYGEVYRDTVLRRGLAELENKQYGFAQGTVPEDMPNFWKQIMEPTIAIIAAGIMVALFFFVRTQ